MSSAHEVEHVGEIDTFPLWDVNEDIAREQRTDQVRRAQLLEDLRELPPEVLNTAVRLVCDAWYIGWNNGYDDHRWQGEASRKQSDSLFGIRAELGL